MTPSHHNINDRKQFKEIFRRLHVHCLRYLITSSFLDFLYLRYYIPIHLILSDWMCNKTLVQFPISLRQRTDLVSLFEQSFSWSVTYQCPSKGVKGVFIVSLLLYSPILRRKSSGKSSLRWPMIHRWRAHDGHHVVRRMIQCPIAN